MFDTLAYMLLLVILLSRQCSGTRQPLRVYGGEDADPETYPFVVRLEMRMINYLTNGHFASRHAHLCTASALSATWAVTAAHCIENLRPYVSGLPFQKFKLVIRYGSVHSKFKNKDAFSDVLSVIPNPLFVLHRGRTKYDIGLVKTTPMALKSYMKLSAVDFSTMYGHEVVFAGFGVTTKNLTEGEIVMDDTLTLKMPLQIFKVVINKCPPYIRVVPMLCLGQRCGAVTTTCGGDSGGPVIHPSGIVAVLSLGITSKYCAHNTANELVDLAGVVFPLGPVMEWIVSYVTR